MRWVEIRSTRSRRRSVIGKRKLKAPGTTCVCVEWSECRRRRRMRRRWFVVIMTQKKRILICILDGEKVMV